MDFAILGPLQALDEGREVPLGGSKQRALLAVLLLHANETLTTDQVIDELWGERPPATAAKTVQVHVSRLRKALAGANGGGVVLTREHGYELQLEPDRLDSHRFERLVAGAPRRRRAGGGAGGAVAARAGGGGGGAGAGGGRGGSRAGARTSAGRPRVRAVRAGRDHPPRRP